MNVLHFPVTEFRLVDLIKATDEALVVLALLLSQGIVHKLPEELTQYSILPIDQMEIQG